MRFPILLVLLLLMLAVAGNVVAGAQKQEEKREVQSAGNNGGSVLRISSRVRRRQQRRRRRRLQQLQRRRRLVKEHPKYRRALRGGAIPGEYIVEVRAGTENYLQGLVQGEADVDNVLSSSVHGAVLSHVKLAALERLVDSPDVLLIEEVRRS